MPETFVCPYHFSSMSPPFPNTVATNVASAPFLVNSPDRSKTSLSICKCSHARIDKQNNLTTIKMSLFTLSKPLSYVTALKQHTDHRKSLAVSSRAEVTQRCLSQQLLGNSFSLCPSRNSLERNVQSTN